tara:strand:- start:8392 stop:9543 length:1152 start_codon:yes stop_codon:yes gene_type:complete
METAESQLLDSGYWNDANPDLRLNPLVPFDDAGLEAFLASAGELRGQVIFATSGSSGAPKLVCVSKTALLASAKAVNSHLRVTVDDRWLCALPTFHVGGFGIWARAFAIGAEAIRYERSWDAQRFVQLCETSEISLTSLVAVQVFDLVKAGLRCPERLRAVVVGGSALSEELGLAAQKLGWPLLQSFGMTESSSQIATQPLESVESPHKNAELPILPCWETRVNAESLLEIRGAPLFSAYLESRSGTWQLDFPFSEDGWFTTRDRVLLSATTLTPLGRGGRTVKILGELVNLDRLEQLLFEAGDQFSDRIALETKPDPRIGEKLVLVVEPSVPESEASQIRNSFDQCVAPFERIQEIAKIEAIPRSPLGKIQRRRLRELLSVV